MHNVEQEKSINLYDVWSHETPEELPTHAFLLWSHFHTEGISAVVYHTVSFILDVTPTYNYRKRVIYLCVPMRPECQRRHMQSSAFTAQQSRGVRPQQCLKRRLLHLWNFAVNLILLHTPPSVMPSAHRSGCRWSKTLNDVDTELTNHTKRVRLDFNARLMVQPVHVALRASTPRLDHVADSHLPFRQELLVAATPQGEKGNEDVEGGRRRRSTWTQKWISPELREPKIHKQLERPWRWRSRDSPRQIRFLWSATTRRWQTGLSVQFQLHMRTPKRVCNQKLKQLKLTLKAKQLICFCYAESFLFQFVNWINKSLICALLFETNWKETILKKCKHLGQDPF